MIDNVKVFKAIGDETRIKILILLSKKNICAKSISKHLGISEAAVSQHIKVLKDIDLVIGYKRGYHVIYDLNKEVIEEAVGFLKLFLNDDICSLNEKFNLSDDNLNIVQCTSNCKVRKSCCMKRFKEE